MQPHQSSRGGFTLIEIMIVVAIMGIAMMIGLPAIGNALHREGLVAAVKDVVEVCSNARAQAILQGKITELHIYPHDGRFVVGGGGAAPAASAAITAATAAPMAENGKHGFSAQLSNRISIELLDVNFSEYKDEPEAVVRFYPNGTSDEFTLVLLGDNAERRKISLEVVTALADVDLLR
jgi:prepilin-type N-terminal cleavage/methylation domain-containing protein